MSALELDYRKCSISTKVGPDIGDSNPGIGLIFSGGFDLVRYRKQPLSEPPYLLNLHIIYHNQYQGVVMTVAIAVATEMFKAYLII